MTPRLKWIGLLVLLVGIGAAAMLVMREQGDETPTVAENRELSTGAPHLIAPADGAEFVEPSVVLDWEWGRALEAGELFALRVWYGDLAPVEIWTAESQAEAQEMIDSFSRDSGPFFWQVAVIRTSEANGFESMVSEWSPVYTLERVKLIPPTPLPEAEQSALAREVASHEFETTAELLDYVRNFIFENSHDGRQDEFEPSYRDALDQIYAASKNEQEKPYLWCDGRSTAMLTLLQELGIESRLIYLYGDGGRSVAQHTVLEVFNPDTQYWEIHDSLYNVYFIDTTNQGRASIERLVFGPFETIAACDASGTCSPEAAEMFAVYYQAFRYGHVDTFWVNPDRFDISKRFPEHDDANLAELLTGNPREFSFKFDSWESR